MVCSAGGRAAWSASGMPPLRIADHALSDEQTELQAVVRRVVRAHQRSSAAESDVFDKGLWQALADLGVLGVGLPGEHGGLVEQVIVAEEVGRAPSFVPYADVMAALQCTARADPAVFAEWAGVVAGSPLLVVALPTPGRDAYVAPAGLLADGLVLPDPSRIWLTSACGEPQPNMGGLPATQVPSGQAGTGVALAAGEQASGWAEASIDHWRLLTAAALAGTAAEMLDLGAEYAKGRTAFGSPIGTYQAVSHALADVAIALQGAERLVRKAAWVAEHEPERGSYLVAVAFHYAHQAAERACRVAIHVQGGLGFTIESPAHIYFRRSKTLGLLSGTSHDRLLKIAHYLRSSPLGG